MEKIKNEKIGFIGLGIMGRGMAHNLLRAGFPLTVWNRSSERVAALLTAGAEAGESPEDVASRSSIIFTCVSDTPDVEQVILGEDGVIHGAKMVGPVRSLPAASSASTSLLTMP